MMQTHIEAATQYYHEVIGGKIPACKNVLNACRRQVNDLRKQGDDFKYVFDEAKGEKICDFVEKLPHTKGKWAAKKQKLKLEPWQKFLLSTLFGWVNKETGYRRFIEVYWEIPRKNGKSMLAATIGLYCFIDPDEYGGEVYSGATTEKQAWEVFRPAKQICDRTPALVERFGIDVRAKNINIIGDGSRFEPLIGNPGDGSSPSCALIDEYHEHKTPDQYDTMVTGMGARDQPIMCIITTAGTDTSGPCYDKRTQMIRVLDGISDDDTVFPVIFGIDEKDDLTDPASLEKANPNLGISVSRDFLITQQKKATTDTSKQNIFKIKHLNTWVNARETWINPESWMKCGEDLNINDFANDDCFISIDLATKIDIAAKMKVFRRTVSTSCEITGQIKDSVHYYLFPSFYLPLDTIQHDDNKHYQRWYNDGLLLSNEGAELDYDMMADQVRDEMSELEIKEIIFDPWRAAHVIHQLQAEGAVCVEYRNTPKNLTESMREVEGAIMGGRIHHGNNPIMNWMITNAIKKNLANELTTIDKERPRNKIDGVTAMVMGIGRAMYQEETVESIYNSTSL